MKIVIVGIVAIVLLSPPQASSALSGCNQAKTTQAPSSPSEQKSHAAPAMAKTIYPRALWGTWRLGPEPCRLPVNPDGDGRLHITDARIVGYETSSEPISVAAETSNTSTWRIKSKENYLGSQVTEEIQVFELDKNTLTVKGDSYEEKYVRCDREINNKAITPSNKIIGAGRKHADMKSFQEIEEGSESIASLQFPKELQGLWIGSEQICPTDREYFDGEFLLEISPEEMFGYEEKYKPTSIVIESTSPKSWHIKLMIDVGPSGYFSESDPMTFTLDRKVLEVERDGAFKTYKKCRLKTIGGGNE